MRLPTAAGDSHRQPGRGPMHSGTCDMLREFAKQSLTVSKAWRLTSARVDSERPRVAVSEVLVVYKWGAQVFYKIHKWLQELIAFVCKDD